MGNLIRRTLILLSLLFLGPSTPVKAQVTTLEAQPLFEDRFIRYSVLRRRAAANSIQLADLQLLSTTGDVIPWPAGTKVTSAGKSPADEGPANLLDNNASTKWLDFTFAASESDTTGTASVLIELPAPLPAIAAIRFRTANDAPERDPVTTLIETSVDGKGWDDGLFLETSAAPPPERNVWVELLVLAVARVGPPMAPPIAVPPLGQASSCRPNLTRVAKEPTAAPVTGQLANVQSLAVLEGAPALTGATAAVVSEIRRTAGTCMGFVYEYRKGAISTWVAQWATGPTTYRQSSTPTATSAYKTRRGAVLRVQTEATRLGR